MNPTLASPSVGSRSPLAGYSSAMTATALLRGVLVVAALAAACGPAGTAAVDRSSWIRRTDSCGGIRRNDNVGFEAITFVVSSSRFYSPSWLTSRECPEGSRWATRQDFWDLTGGVGISHNNDNNNGAYQCTGPGTYFYRFRCGWYSYFPPRSVGGTTYDESANRYAWIFRDTDEHHTFMGSNTKGCAVQPGWNSYRDGKVGGLVCIDDDAGPPDFASEAEKPRPVPGSVKSRGAKFVGTLDEPGTLHCLALPFVDAAAVPSGPQVRDGVDANSVPRPKASSPAGSGELLVDFDGLLEPATHYQVWCAGEDDEAPAASKLRLATVLGNVQSEASLAGEIFTDGCVPGDAEVRTPTLDAGASQITAAGDLVLAWKTSRHFATHRFAFDGREGVAGCSMPAAAPTADEPAGDVWERSLTEFSCDASYTFRRPAAAAIGECAFEESGSDAAFTRYFARVVVTTTEAPSSDVYGAAGEVVKTVQSTVEVGLEFPTDVSVATVGSAEVFPAFAGLVADGRALAATTTQTFDTGSNTATVRLVTSVAWPYELAGVALADRSAAPGSWLLLGAAEDATAAACALGEVCGQEWDLTLKADTDSGQCDLDGVYRVSFTVRCSALYDGACDTPTETATLVDITLASQSFCPQVVEVASVTPSLKTYSSDPAAVGGAPEDSIFVIGSVVHARVALAFEGGVLPQSVELTDVSVASLCSGDCVAVRHALVDSEVVDALVDWSSSNGAGTSEPHADFSFRVTFDAVNFDDGRQSGEGDVQLTARVRVTYADASGQRHSRVVTASSAAAAAGTGGPNTLTSAATSTIGVRAGSSPSPDSSSSSSAGALGVGVPVLAGAAAVAAIAVAVIAVAVRVRQGRRRRHTRSASGRGRTTIGACQSSSTSSFCAALDVDGAGSAVAVDVQAGADTGQSLELEFVAEAYGRIRV